MIAKIRVIVGGFLVLTGCTSQEPEIQLLCQRDGIGNYIIKWEMNPEAEGLVKLYVSDNPDMSQSSPAGYADIHDGVMRYITNDNISRKYFRLSFDGTYERDVASRSLLMDSVQNFRDMGGYLSRRGRSTRWGVVYRSGEINRLSERDTLRLNRLKIKTIIDLRTAHEIALSPVNYSGARIVHLPVFSDVDDIIRRIGEGRVRKGDGFLSMQDVYLQYMEPENGRAFARALHVFLDESNYPILFYCSLGKDRAGFLASLLLSALDVPEETIFSDYVATNDFIDLKPYAGLVNDMDTDAQEAMTVILSANETFLDLVFRKIKKEYGSLSQYLSEEMQLTDKQKEKLKDILLF
ncbi:MAG: tyrosine-protein phosphatase [Tannerellaceae bacterium]|jgi:protein-tyrosine phosphatase|nr:tyrosine-protein phosphatase [Tannerellaceae bacterium]